jgi:hypothetical protein
VRDFPAGEAEAQYWLYWLGTIQTKGKKPENWKKVRDAEVEAAIHVLQAKSR